MSFQNSDPSCNFWSSFQSTNIDVQVANCTQKTYTFLEVSTLRIAHGSVTMRAGTPRSSSHPTPGLQTAGSRGRPRLTASALVPWRGPAGRSPWRSWSTRQSIICSRLGRRSSSSCSVLLLSVPIANGGQWTVKVGFRLYSEMRHCQVYRVNKERKHTCSFIISTSNWWALSSVQG